MQLIKGEKLIVSAFSSSANLNTNKPSFTSLPSKYRVVSDELIRGPHPLIKDLIALKKEGVTQIFDFRHDCMRGYKWVERMACKLMGINYQRRQFSFFNKRPKLEDFEAISKEVAMNAKQGGKTLFHCNSGSHRTALFSAFYSLTKGEPLAKVETQANFAEKVEEVINEQIINSRFFTRNRVKPESLNPIRHFRNQFNNKVVKNTEEALSEFFDMLQYKPKVS